MTDTVNNRKKQEEEEGWGQKCVPNLQVWSLGLIVFHDKTSPQRESKRQQGGTVFLGQSIPTFTHILAFIAS